MTITPIETTFYPSIIDQETPNSISTNNDVFIAKIGQQNT